MKSKFATPLGLVTMWLMGGMGYPILTVATKYLTPMNLVFVRSFGTSLILLAILLILKPRDLKEIKLDKRLLVTFICAILFYPLCSGSLAYASSQIPGALTALLYSALPVISTIYLLFRGQEVPRGVLIGLAIAIAALIILVGTPSGNITPLGVLAGILSVLIWFIATEIWIAFNPNYSILLASTLQAIFGALGSYIVRPLFDSGPIYLENIVKPSVLFLIFSLATQHFAYLWLTTKVNAVTLMLFSIINPFIAGVTGFLLFDQQITGTQVFAGLLMVTGVYQIITRQRQVTIS